MTGMKLVALAVPALAVAACKSPADPDAHVVIEVEPGWTGTAEVMVHTHAGTLVSRAPLTGNQDVAITEGDTVSVALHDGTTVAVDSDLDVSQGDTLLFLEGPLT